MVCREKVVHLKEFEGKVLQRVAREYLTKRKCVKAWVIKFLHCAIQISSVHINQVCKLKKFSILIKSFLSIVLIAVYNVINARLLL